MPRREADTRSPHKLKEMLQEDPNILSYNMLQILSGGLEHLTAQVTAQVVWHCRLPCFAIEIRKRILSTRSDQGLNRN